MHQRRIFIIAALLYFTTINTVSAQIANIIGTWEASAQIENYAHHHVLRFADENSYEFIILSDDPSNPLETHIGSFSQTTDQIILTPLDPTISTDTLQISSQTSFIKSNGMEFFRGQEFDEDIRGTWELFGPDGSSTGGTFTVLPDGRFETDVSTGHEKGWYVIAGTGMIHFPTETSDPKLLGIPGLWTHIEVSDDELSYRIATTDITITGRRIAVSAILAMTWSSVKMEIFNRKLSNGR